MYDVLDISYYIINYSNENKYGISNLKLQKLLYFIQAYFLITIEKPCFFQDIQAWDFGPVVPESYHEFKKYGNCNIPYIEKSFSNGFIKAQDKKKIESIIHDFSCYSATDLVSLTHKQTPWINAYQNGYNSVISNESIEEYFRE